MKVLHDTNNSRSPIKGSRTIGPLSMCVCVCVCLVREERCRRKERETQMTDARKGETFCLCLFTSSGNRYPTVMQYGTNNIYEQYFAT